MIEQITSFVTEKGFVLSSIIWGIPLVIMIVCLFTLTTKKSKHIAIIITAITLCILLTLIAFAPALQKLIS